MRKFIPLFALLFAFTPSNADYQTIYLPQLIERSTLIAEVEIVKVSDNVVHVQIKEVLKGGVLTAEIIVHKFENWTCAFRWSEYKVGQREIMFLKQSKVENHWYTLGAGNEGELPIENGQIFYKNSYIELGIKPSRFPLEGGGIYGYKFDLKEAKDAIEEYLRNIEQIKALILDNKILAYQTNNSFLERILGELNKLENR